MRLLNSILLATLTVTSLAFGQTNTLKPTAKLLVEWTLTDPFTLKETPRYTEFDTIADAFKFVVDGMVVKTPPGTSIVVEAGKRTFKRLLVFMEVPFKIDEPTKAGSDISPMYVCAIMCPHGFKAGEWCKCNP